MTSPPAALSSQASSARAPAAGPASLGAGGLSPSQRAALAAAWKSPIRRIRGTWRRRGGAAVRLDTLATLAAGGFLAASGPDTRILTPLGRSTAWRILQGD